MVLISDTEGSDLVNPLVDRSYLSLFRRTLSSSSVPSITQFSNSNSSISDALNTHLKARVLSSPDKLLKQTKTILEEAVFAEKEKVPRERRPGLGLKRAKFSAKPIPSQSAATLDFSIDVDKLSDPVEYFAAYERMENAKKEVQRLKGEPLLDLDQNRASLAPRLRRPSLLGRSATYTHRFSSSITAADVDETLLNSQETFVSDVLSPTRGGVLPDATVTKNSPRVRVPEPKSTTASKFSELDELLGSSFEGLDEDGLQNLLRDKLQIKALDIGKTFFPDWRVQLRESSISSSALRKKNEAVIHLSGKSKATRSGDKVSPAKSNSPLASLSFLNRHIAKRTPSMDPFSPIHGDLSSAEATDPTREPEKRVDRPGQSDEVNLLEIRSSTVNENENIAVSGEDPSVSVAKDADPISKPREKENGVGQSELIGNRKDSCESAVHLEENIAVFGEDPSLSVEKDADPISKPKEKEDGVGQSEPIGKRKDSCESGRSAGHIEENIAVSGEDSPVLASNDIGPASEPERHDDEVDAARLPIRQLIFEGVDRESFCSSGGVKPLSTIPEFWAGEPLSTENISVEEPSEEAAGSSKRRLQEKEKSKVPSEAVLSEERSKKGRRAKKNQLEAPVASEARNKRRKVEDSQPGHSKGDKNLRRTSLYYAGTKWEAGVRRSTRIRMRPLEYWRGERFLYGRVHQSLLTVIGVKYASPSNPGVKVKSFVSDEYKDMVEFASH
ncbi:centromere protein C [Spinacia oleracea]|uniref:Centromere protein C n=1 Tax=Spinacia oleracea TaxID=3562 RepID=A0A9R0IFD5_SPIOL|nr:centromere protein C [Spinacia oleracea]